MSVAYNPKIASDGIVLYYDISNKKTTGTQYIIKNMVTPYPTGSSTEFRGISYTKADGYGCITWSGSEAWQPTYQPFTNNEMSVSSWIYYPNNNSTWAGFFDILGGTSLSFDPVTAGGDMLVIIFMTTTATATGRADVTIPASAMIYNSWAFVSFVFKYTGTHTYCQFFINDNLVATSPSVSGNLTHAGLTTLRMGRAGYSGGNASFGTGKIASFMLYNRALSIQEVVQNYNATKWRFNT